MDTPKIVCFEVGPFDRFLRGHYFAYIDVYHCEHLCSQDYFEGFRLKVDIKNIVRNKKFRRGDTEAVVVLARSKNSIEDIEEALVHLDFDSEYHEIRDLYELAHEDGMFTDLSDTRMPPQV
jgi:hypothetical protein